MTHEPLIAWFLKKLLRVARHPKFRAWKEKHQGECPYLAQERSTLLSQVFVLLEEASSYFVRMGIFTAGNSLPAEKHNPVIKLTGNFIVRMKEGVQ